MRVEKAAGRWRLRLGFMLVLLLLVLGTVIGYGMSVSAVDKPNAQNIFVYNSSAISSSNRIYPAVYILTNGTDSEAVYSVYSDSQCTDLLGQGRQIAREGFCAVTLSKFLQANQTLYVTRKVGEEESGAVQISAGTRQKPTVALNMNLLNEQSGGQYQLPASSYTEVSGFLGQTVGAGGTLVKDRYYQVEVKLTGFTAIDAVLIPLRYDTRCLKPATVFTSNRKYYLSSISDEDLSAAQKGLTFAIPSADGYCSGMTYGVLPGMNFQTWKDASTGKTGSFSLPTERGAYQSVNTSTGLFKLQASIANPAAFGSGSATQFVRFYFRATEDVTLEQMPVWFATESDCPEEAKDSDTLRLSYFDPAAPGGIAPTLSGANVMSPPPELKTAEENTEETQVVFSAAEIPALPVSYFSAVDAVKLQEKEVKIYNYTNYSSKGDGIGTLDMSTPDRLCIDSSPAIQTGDTVRVYTYDGMDYTKIGEGVASGDRKVNVDLGMNKLLPAGGTVFVTTERSSGESPMVEVPYPEEVNRDVTFRVCRSGWTEGHATEDFNSHPDALEDVKRGERLQIRIYFNNFRELMSYGFAIHFDPKQVQAADRQYEVMETGTVLEEAYQAGGSCFSTGADLSSVTLTEQVIYQTAQRGDAAEIAQLLEELNLDEAAFRQIAADVELKYNAGVSEGDTVPWKGGLLFTGERSDDSGLPYVNNQGGCVQFLSASLVKPSTMEREGGYHFLSVNFVAVRDGDPEFRLATDLDTAYCAILPQGKQIVLMGGESGLGMTEHWEAAPMGTQLHMTLAEGNSGEAENPEALYLYDGAFFRDPGFTVAYDDGMEVPKSEVKRYFASGGEIVLPAYEDSEALSAFRIPEDGYSAHYTLYYEYGTEGTGMWVQKTRDIYIIYRKGDVNRDGYIDLFDEQALADHVSGIVPLDLADELYRTKTVDVDQDGEIGSEDRAQLRRYSLGLSEITQDYVMPVP